MKRRKVIAGNWKMNKKTMETSSYIYELENLVKGTKNDVIICVPYTNLTNAVISNKNIKIGAQNMHWEENGAYTGEISPTMLKEIGINYVIIGHSERRQYCGETDETVNKKVKSALKHKINPIICVGEDLLQREEGKAKGIITTQTRLALEGLSKEQVKKVTIAYEPIWAIGTGKTATSQDANESIKSIREEIEHIYGSDVSKEVIILYGGSVKASNAKELFETSDIDGGLVGGASLDPEEFAKIVNYDK